MPLPGPISCPRRRRLTVCAECWFDHDELPAPSRPIEVAQPRPTPRVDGCDAAESLPELLTDPVSSSP